MRFILPLTLLFLSACSSSKTEKLIMDHDIFNELSKNHVLEAKDKGLFVEVSLKTEAEAELLKEDIHHIAHEMGRCGGFTEDTPEEIERFTKIIKEQHNKVANLKANDFELNQVDESKSTFQFLSENNLEETIKFLSSYQTRSAKSSNPNKPLQDFIAKLNEDFSEFSDSYSLNFIEHSGSEQGSIHVQIIGSESPDEHVILGGHIDSIAGFFSRSAPGADDNASGSAVVFETLKAILAADIHPKRTIDFYWYGAEEQGLIGSKEIAKDYFDRGVDVVAAMQLDMVLYPGNGDVIGLTTDFTDPVATLFMERLVTEHLNLPVERFTCGYGCSDHASWHRNGYKAVYPFEATFRTHNKNIHSTRDVLDSRTSIEHALRFAKLATAFIIETSQSDIRF